MKTYTIKEAEKLIKEHTNVDVKFNDDTQNFEEVKYYTEGDLFSLDDSILQLIRIESNKFMLIEINSGNRWSDKIVKCDSVINQNNIIKMLDGSKFENVIYLGNIRDKRDFLKCLSNEQK